MTQSIPTAQPQQEPQEPTQTHSAEQDGVGTVPCSLSVHLLRYLPLQPCLCCHSTTAARHPVLAHPLLHLQQEQEQEQLYAQVQHDLLLERESRSNGIGIGERERERIMMMSGAYRRAAAGEGAAGDPFPLGCPVIPSSSSSANASASANANADDATRLRFEDAIKIEDNERRPIEDALLPSTTSNRMRLGRSTRTRSSPFASSSSFTNPNPNPLAFTTPNSNNTVTTVAATMTPTATSLSSSSSPLFGGFEEGEEDEEEEDDNAYDNGGEEQEEESSQSSSLLWAPPRLHRTTTTTTTSTPRTTRRAAATAAAQRKQQRPLRASPLVVAPMMMMSRNTVSPPLPSSNNDPLALVADYIACCRFYSGSHYNSTNIIVVPNIGVLTTLRFSLPSLRVSHPFTDADMLPLSEFLLYYYQHAPHILQFLTRLDFSIVPGNPFTAGRRTRRLAGGNGNGLLHLSSSSSFGASSHGLRSHGALCLAKVLQQAHNHHHIREVFVNRNFIGAYGASALFLAVATTTATTTTHSTLRVLQMRRCRIGERGALALCDIVLCEKKHKSKSKANAKAHANHTSGDYQWGCGLTEIDLSANYIGARGLIAIETALQRRRKQLQQLQQHYPGAKQQKEDNRMILMINLEGNLVLQEIINGVTHGLGVLLALVGAYLLHTRVVQHYNINHHHNHDSHTHTQRSVALYSCAIYSLSLIVLYVSSTLFHSFCTMLHTRYLFAVLDKCAIYILIAGSYTPCLQIALAHDPLYSTYLLAFLWICAGLGIYVETCCPVWSYKAYFSLALYLGLGWSALVCLPELARVRNHASSLLSSSSSSISTSSSYNHASHASSSSSSSSLLLVQYMILGGVAYTAGVPFFVRNHHLDHAVWHMFVLAGSILHWCGIYFHILDC